MTDAPSECAAALGARDHPVIRRQGQELGELVGQDQLAQQRRRRGVAAGAITLLADAAPDPGQLLLEQPLDQGAVDRRPAVDPRAVAAATARPARARSPRWRRPPSGCRSARSRCRAATPRGTARRRQMLWRRPRSVIVPSGTASRSARGHARRRRAARAIWFGLRHVLRRTPPARSAPGRGARPRCRRGRRSPRAACRRAPCRAPRSFAAGSSLIGICAAMPPIACAPRRWQVWISELGVGAQEGAGHRHLAAVGQHARRVVPRTS